NEEEATAWERVKAANNPDELLEFIDRYPTSTHRPLVIQRMRALISEATGTTRRKTSGLIMSKLAAFLLGLTFRIPSFQLSTSGLFSSIGLALGFSIVLVIGVVTIAVIGYYAETTLGWSRFSTAILMASFLILLCIAGLRQFHKWISQRNFAAA